MRVSRRGGRAVGIATLLLVGTALAAAQTQQRDRTQEPYDAFQRPPPDPEAIQRGQALYGLHCRACHGVDLRGGDLGGPNLLRSQLVLSDLDGELIWPVIRDGQSTPGGSSMPPQSVSEDDGHAVSVYLHSVLATATRQGGPPEGADVELNILIGDAEAGRTYFEANCASCHSPTGDLAGIASAITEAQELQNTWVRGRRLGAERRPVTVRVTLPSGEQVSGTLDRHDDFYVSLVTAGGERRSFSRRGNEPRVELDDPAGRHTELLPIYTDTDIHNVTAYLATLR